MDLDGVDCIKLIVKVYEKELKKIEEKREQTLLHLWGYMLPFTEKPLSFEDYKNQAMGKKKVKASKQDNKELIERMEAIKNRHQSKG